MHPAEADGHATADTAVVAEAREPADNDAAVVIDDEVGLTP